MKKPRKKARRQGAWKGFEREAARHFSLWLSQGHSKTVLCRQSLHGRMIERIHGDLAPHPDCPSQYKEAADWFVKKCYLDAKRRISTSTLDTILDGSEVLEWAAKAKENADRFGRIWFLLIWRPARDPIVVFERSGLVPLDPPCWMAVRRVNVLGSHFGILKLGDFVRCLYPPFFGFRVEDQRLATNQTQEKEPAQTPRL